MRPRALRGVTLLLLGLLLAVAPASQAGAVPPLEEVLRSVGFSDEDIARVRAGEMVKGVMEGSSERELAIKLAFLVKAPPRHMRDVFFSSRDYAYDPAVKSWGPIRGEGSTEDLAKLELGEAMAQAYLQATPGIELNLSREEIAGFRALADRPGSARARVEPQLREVLLQRFRAYRRKGLDGIPPYARPDGRDFAPGEGLRRKTELHQTLATDAPTFYRALLRYPADRPEGLEDGFYWVESRVDEKSTIALVHRMDMLEGEVYIFADRTFYVSRSHNSVQTTGGAFPVEEGTVVLYLNRTSTDRVGGFGSATKRSLGQRVMAGQIAAIFDRIREGEAR